MTPNGVAGGSPDRRLRPGDRLRRNPEFQRVYREGKSYPGRYIVLFVLRAPDAPLRAGFVAGRRVGNAVHRNRAKRLLREAFRLRKAGLHARGYELVLVARRGCGEARFEDVDRELAGLLERVGLAGESSVAPALPPGENR